MTALFLAVALVDVALIAGMLTFARWLAREDEE